MPKRKNIFCSGTDLLYLTRWEFRLPFGYGIYLHRFHESDVRVFHDHPWDFISIILWGGYKEFSPDRNPRGYPNGNPKTVVCRYRGLFSTARRRAEDLHYVRLIKDSAWTLVLRGPRRREWGFQTSTGWVKWDEYLRSRYNVESSEVVS